MTEDTKDQAPDGVHISQDDDAEDTEGHIKFRSVEPGEGPEGVHIHVSDDDAEDTEGRFK
jgi:hypothetical protein